MSVQILELPEAINSFDPSDGFHGGFIKLFLKGILSLNVKQLAVCLVSVEESKEAA